jgi:small basic protein
MYQLIYMQPIISGVVSGIIFGAVSVAMMLPMSFPDKTTALLAAFASRFAIGFVIACVQLPSWPGWAIGLVFGLLLSLPDAIITKAYAPILILAVQAALSSAAFCTAGTLAPERRRP